jgi:hypothetical protein
MEIMVLDPAVFPGRKLSLAVILILEGFPFFPVLFLGENGHSL